MAKGRKTGGRKRGVPNVTTKNAREAFQAVYQQLGGPRGMFDWANSSPQALGSFYSLYARLIPIEHVGDGGEGPVQTIVKHIFPDAKP